LPFIRKVINLRKKGRAKKLIALVIIFSFIFAQSFTGVETSFAQETDESDQQSISSFSDLWQEHPHSQTEGEESSSQSTDDSDPSPAPTSDSSSELTDDSQTNEAPPDESSDPVVTEESVENQGSLDDPLNENTGAQSENTASYDEEEKVFIFNANRAWIENRIDSYVNTGWNRANYNTGDSLISTGQAYAWGRLQTKANTNSISVPLSFEDDPVGPIVVQNDATGSESLNLAEGEILNEVEIVNENNFVNLNEIGILSNTGGNEAKYNTGSGMIASGDAQAAVDLVVNANSNFINSEDSVMGSFSLFGENTGDLDFSNFGQAPDFEDGEGALAEGFIEADLSYFETDEPVLASNTTTGPDSENYAVLEATSSAKIINDNLAVVENDVLVAATTGDNTASYNTGDGVIESGDADLIANVVNFINSNVVNSEVILATINIFGQWIGDLILPSLGLAENSSEEAMIIDSSHENTGSDSDNEATTVVDSELEVINENSGLIVNDLNPEANTGENLADYNTMGAAIETGDVSAQGALASIVNTNITNTSPILLIINVLGEWVGEIISPSGTVSHSAGEQDVIVYSTFGGESINFTDGPVTLIESFNEDTGSNSENVAEIDIEDKTLIKNSNDFMLENNISLLADTGGNEASCNTGQGIIESGDADLVSTLVNFVNVNMVDANPIIAVINVFGEWLGDILAPNQKVDLGDDSFDPGTDSTNSSDDSSDSSSNEDSSSQDSNDDNLPGSLDSGSNSSSQDEDSSQDQASLAEVGSQDDPPTSTSNDNHDGEQAVLGFLVNDSDSGSGFSGGSFSGEAANNASPGESSSVLKAKLFFDPYGFYTSSGIFLVASPQVLKKVSEKGASLVNKFIPKLSILPLMVIIVTSILNFIKKPILG
jgi:hypothetical protein